MSTCDFFSIDAILEIADWEMHGSSQKFITTVIKVQHFSAPLGTVLVAASVMFLVAATELV